MRVLEDGGFFFEQVSHRLLSFWIAIRPERLHWIEGRPDAFDIGVPVLHDDAFDCVLVSGGDAIAHRCAVILHVDAELLQTEDTEEQFLNVSGEIVEGVLELACVRRIAVAKANVIRRNHVKFVRQLRDQVAEHMRRAWESRAAERWLEKPLSLPRDRRS